MTETPGPNISKLRKKVVQLVGSNKHTENEIKAACRQYYAAMPENIVDSSVETVLLKLNAEGLIELGTGFISLTNSGLDQYRKFRLLPYLKAKHRQQVNENKSKKTAVEQKKAASRGIHEAAKLKVGELAALLGKDWEQEHEHVSGVILDVVWYKKARSISHAFEVQHRGEWKNAIGNLEAISRYIPDCKLFMVVVNKAQIPTVQQLIGARRDSIRVLTASQIEEWTSILEKVNPDMRLKVFSVTESLRQLGLFL